MDKRKGLPKFWSSTKPKVCNAGPQPALLDWYGYYTFDEFHASTDEETLNNETTDKNKIVGNTCKNILINEDTIEKAICKCPQAKTCDDANFVFTMYGLPTHVSWLGSHTESMTAAVTGVWYCNCIYKSEPYFCDKGQRCGTIVLVFQRTFATIIDHEVSLLAISSYILAMNVSLASQEVLKLSSALGSESSFILIREVVQRVVPIAEAKSRARLKHLKRIHSQLDFEALRETLKDEAKHKKEWEARMKEKVAHDELFRIEFRVIFDSESY
uniref:Uncharacterized protein n=1 Tax=Tanacetum cinerariifolium TaxID=118510 RepID=A0A6L2P660_TANCI|nr:hypothetical protein [Tanacetum cinerariifolium]